MNRGGGRLNTREGEKEDKEGDDENLLKERERERKDEDTFRKGTGNWREKYRGRGISRVKGSVCFVLKFTLPPFSSSLSSVVEVLKHNRH